MKMKKHFFIVLIFILFSIPYSIIGNHLFNIIKDFSSKNALSYMDFQVKTLSANISDILISKYDIFKIARKKDFISKSLEEKKKEILNIYKENPSIVKEISIVNRQGIEIFSTKKNKKYENYKNNILFLNAKNEYFSIGSVKYPENEPPELLMAETTKDGYVLMARLNLGYLNEEIIKMLKKMSGEIVLIDAGNQIIFDSNYKYLFRQGEMAEKPISKLVEGLIKNGLTSYSGIININGTDTLIAIDNVESTAWWIYEKKPKKNVIDYSLNKWAKRILFTGYIIILIFSYLSYKLALVLLKEN